ncbi:MAG: IS5/IS1182 family transposase, partial [Eubacteriales bacterium]|nr:IS5/IS1182 family transposase [Eubacteriales bacterium]
AMRYTPYRGLTAVANWVKLKYAAMNLKKLAVHKWKESHPSLRYLFVCLFHVQFYTKNPIPA